jgi:predicted transglutaminase-like cysteine proteinase
MAIFTPYPQKRAHRTLCRSHTLLWLLLASVTMAASLGITEAMLATITEQYGRSARSRVIDWQTLVDANIARSDVDKLYAVNGFFNRNRFISDQEHWQKADYWATPIEFIGTKGGDCEDFVIAKYITLRALGVPDAKLRITYVKSLSLNQAHMVLTYYASPREVPLVLDNLINQIQPASSRTDLLPVYSFNGDGLWKAKMNGEGQKIGTADELDMWQDFIVRLQREKASP